MRRIYLDYNATTPLDPRVSEAMRPHLETQGNPSSPHAEGRSARVALDGARARLARLLGATPEEIVFTSGGTEANNLAILGAARAARERGRHLLATRVEHASVLGPLGRLAAEGFEVEFMPVGGDGRLDPVTLSRALRADTALVALQAANNETGALQPIDEVAALLPREVVFHCDATQAIGKIPLPEGLRRANLVAVSGHKVHGPRGVGALVHRRGTRIEPISFGGGQERGLRPGTEDVAGLVGLATAVELAFARQREYGERVGTLAATFLARIERAIPEARLHGSRESRLPNTVNLALPCFDGRALLIALDLAGIAASAGSACASGAVEASPVLLAMGIDHEEATRSVRFSLGWGLDGQDVEEASRRIVDVAVRLSKTPPC